MKTALKTRSAPLVLAAAAGSWAAVAGAATVHLQGSRATQLSAIGDQP